MDIKFELSGMVKCRISITSDPHGGTDIPHSNDNITRNTYLELYIILPFGCILIIAFGTVTQCVEAAFSLGKNKSGTHIRSKTL